MNDRKEVDPNGQPHRFHIDWTMLGVVVALLAFFATMWTHLSGRIDAVQAAGSGRIDDVQAAGSKRVEVVHERVEVVHERVDDVHSTLREISETLGRLDQRTQKIDAIDAKVDRLLESVSELRGMSHTHPAPAIQPQSR